MKYFCLWFVCFLNRELAFVFLMCNLKIILETLQSLGLFFEAFELSVFPPDRKSTAEEAELWMGLKGSLP